MKLLYLSLGFSIVIVEGLLIGLMSSGKSTSMRIFLTTLRAPLMFSNFALGLGVVSTFELSTLAGLAFLGLCISLDSTPLGGLSWTLAGGEVLGLLTEAVVGVCPV